MIKRRLLSVISALTLVLSLFTLLPEGALKAHADLLSGSGTQADPYIITNITELGFALDLSEATKSKTTYYKLGADILRPDDSNRYDASLTFTSNYDQKIYLDLAGHKIIIYSREYKNALFNISGGKNNCSAELYISDSKGEGKISYDTITNQWSQHGSLFELKNGGRLTINGGRYETSKSDDSANCFSVGENSYLHIIDGEFYSSDLVVGNSGTAVIDSGRFYNSHETGNYSYYGLISNKGNITIKSCELSSNEDAEVGIKEITGKSLRSWLDKDSVLVVDGNIKTIGEEEVNIKGKNIKIAHKISDVNITLPEVKAGEKLPIISNITSGLKAQMEWRYSGTENPVYSEALAVAGTAYDLVVYLYPNDDFHALVDPTVTVNGTEPCTVSTGGTSVIATYTVVPKISVTDVLVNINKPVAGETIGSRSESYGYSSNVLVRTRDSARYRNLFYWHDGTKYLSDNAVFEGGKYYYAYVKFKAAEGYELSDNMNVKIEGVSASKVSITTDEYGQKWALYSAKFYCHGDSLSRLVGDLNGDGTITADDAIIAARLAAGYGDYASNYDSDVADMNRDGKVTADDAIIIARYAANYGDYRSKYTKYI